MRLAGNQLAVPGLRTGSRYHPTALLTLTTTRDNKAFLEFEHAPGNDQAKLLLTKHLQGVVDGRLRSFPGPPATCWRRGVPTGPLPLDLQRRVPCNRRHGGRYLEVHAAARPVLFKVRGPDRTAILAADPHRSFSGRRACWATRSACRRSTSSQALMKKRQQQQQDRYGITHSLRACHPAVPSWDAELLASQTNLRAWGAVGPGRQADGR
jgi:hypothetical protein